MKQIETDRLILRSFEVTDAEGIFGYLENPPVNCFKNEQIATMRDAELEAENKSKDPSKIAVVLKESNFVIGELFYDFSEPDTYSLAWNFNTDFTGKGYASESTNALIDDFFTNQNARRLFAYIEDDNYSSQKLAERLGMRREGLFLEFISFIEVDGSPKYENTYQYALLKKEWLSK